MNYDRIALLTILAVMGIAIIGYAVSSDELDELCSIDGNILQRINGIWSCVPRVQPHATYSDNTDQQIAVKTQLINLSNTDHQERIVKLNNTHVLLNTTGSYLISISAILSSGVVNKEANIWLKKNDINMNNTNTRIKLGNTVESVLSVTIIEEFTAGDRVSFAFESDSTTVKLESTAATATAPASPGIIVGIMKI